MQDAGHSTSSTRSAMDLAHESASRRSGARDIGGEEARVRFSQNMERATVPSDTSTPIRRATDPSNAVSTNPENTVGEVEPLMNSPARATSNSTVPARQRTRDRAFSLRRSLLTRSINGRISRQGQGQPSSSRPELYEEIELNTQEGGKLQAPSTKVSHVDEKITELTVPAVVELGNTQSKKGKWKEEGSFGTSRLPNYDNWVRKQEGHSDVVNRIKWVFDTLSDHDAVRFLFRNPRTLSSKDGRHIQLDLSQEMKHMDERTGKPYVDNTVHSSRYTAWDFVPRQLFFQFSRLANFYFLIISILQFIPGLSPVSNYTTIAPLLLFVFISMGKEGYDDLRRYRLDQVENNKETLGVACCQEGLNTSETLNFRKERFMWRIQGGTIFRNWRCQSSLEREQIRPMEEAPSTKSPWKLMKWKDIKVGDVIKLRRDEDIPADMVLLHSDGPDGITYVETMALDGETNLKPKQPSPHLASTYENPDGIMKCQALFMVEDPNSDLYNFEGRLATGGKLLPLTLNEILFRGSTIRNTDNVIGMVINTGEETKMRMNANKSPRIKAPELQKIVNKVVIILVIFVILLALFCTIAYQLWTKQTENDAWYVAGAHINFAFTMTANIILINTLIPLSLYVSLEIIKVGQVVLMRDIEMYDPVTDTPMACNTSTILENLGQVDYVFTDKTGTLTENVMHFRKISVGGYAWLHDADLQPSNEIGKGKAKEISKVHVRAPSSGSASNHYNTDTRPSTDAPRRSSSASHWKSTTRPDKRQADLHMEELMRYLRDKPRSVNSKRVRSFLIAIALCHTCLPEVQVGGDIEYQGASPDELALVRAAKELGYLVSDRQTSSISLLVTDGADAARFETYQILDVIEFSSSRKRMSVIVQGQDGQRLLICKGADSAIVPRLKHGALALNRAAEVHRRSSVRRSMEAERALRRLSEQSQSLGSRNSLNLSRARKSIGHGRPSLSGKRLQPIRDGLDSWLDARERDDLEMAIGEESSIPPATIKIGFQSKRRSSGRMSHSALEDSVNAFDAVVDEAVILDEATVFERCFQHIDDFAREGLRTLLYGTRLLDEQEYQSWKQIYHDATTSLVDRQDLVEQAGEMIEQDLDLAGATAIEDKLQDGCADTIDKLRRANIKIWMLTGDKRETAINIAHSARICKSYSEIVVLDHQSGDMEQTMARTLVAINRKQFAHTVVVVDGSTLAEIDSDYSLGSLFFDLAVLTDSVICCRASPSQKAALVRKIRTKVEQHSITLAIGDGANDIPMLREAGIGVGISGREGLQAARVSDYSISQFRFLQRLLLVHGHWNYARTTKYILCTFWKELTFYMIQAHWQRFNGYTSTSFFDSLSLTVFNTLFTSLCVIFIGMFEQDLSASTLMTVPELYSYGQQNRGFNLLKYFAWMFMAACEATMIFYIMFGLYGQSMSVVDNGIFATGDICFSVAVIFINTKIL